jgi:hypothetical protein
LDESEQPPIHDASRRAAAPLIGGVFAAPDSRLYGLTLRPLRARAGALASLRRTGSRLVVCRGARCPPSRSSASPLPIRSLSDARASVRRGVAQRPGLENRCRPFGRPWVRIPPPPLQGPFPPTGAGDLRIARCVRPLSGRVNERQRTSFLARVHSPAIPPAGRSSRRFRRRCDALTSVTASVGLRLRTALAEEPCPPTD